MRIIRQLLGRVVERVESCVQSSRPAPLRAGLYLYHYSACPFCIKVRGALRRINIGVELCDIDADAAACSRLVLQGGKRQVPCLYIATEQPPRWLYESDAIIAYLRQLTAGSTGSIQTTQPLSSDQ